MIYVLAYPEFEPSMAESIDRFRAAHEPARAKLVPPHVTLVFGLRNAYSQEFLALCESVAGRVSELAVEFSASEVVHDPYENAHKLLLLCSTGTCALIALHQQIYDGSHRAERQQPWPDKEVDALQHRAELNLDVPYRPHMTLATHKDRTILERLEVAALGAFPITGTIRALEVVELAGNSLHQLRTIALRK